MRHHEKRVYIRIHMYIHIQTCTHMNACVHTHVSSRIQIYAFNSNREHAYSYRNLFSDVHLYQSVPRPSSRVAIQGSRTIPLEVAIMDFSCYKIQLPAGDEKAGGLHACCQNVQNGTCLSTTRCGGIALRIHQKEKSGQSRERVCH
jgi:hypothetical protein